MVAPLLIDAIPPLGTSHKSWPFISFPSCPSWGVDSELENILCEWSLSIDPMHSLLARHGVLYMACPFPHFSCFPSCFCILEDISCAPKISVSPRQQHLLPGTSQHLSNPFTDILPPLNSHRTFHILDSCECQKHTHESLYLHIYRLFILPIWTPKTGRRSRGKTRGGHQLQPPLPRMTADRGQGLPDHAVTAISHALHLQNACQVPRLNQSSSPDDMVPRNQSGNLTTLVFVSFGKLKVPSPSSPKRRSGKNVWFSRQNGHVVQKSRSSRQEYMSPRKTRTTSSTSLSNIRERAVSMSPHGTST